MAGCPYLDSGGHYPETTFSRKRLPPTGDHDRFPCERRPPVIHAQPTPPRARDPSLSSGDFNGDGNTDLLIGAFEAEITAYQSGAAYVVYGPIVRDRPLAAANVRLEGDAASFRLGVSVAGVGDVDGDGKDDILIGSPGATGNLPGTGAAYLFTATLFGNIQTASATVTILGEVEASKVGQVVSGAGDVNGDGFADFLVTKIGANPATSSFGGVYVFFGGPVRG